MRSRYKFTEKEGIYFLTSTVVDWLPIFTSESYFEILINSLKFCREKKGLQVFAYVILDNHFHLVAWHPDDLSAVIKSLKMFTAAEIIARLQQDNKCWFLNQLAFAKKRYKTGSQHQVWQEGSHPQLIMNEQMLVQKIEYIHQNPVKRGFVREPQDWKYSSAVNYILDDHSVLEIDDIGML